MEVRCFAVVMLLLFRTGVHDVSLCIVNEQSSSVWYFFGKFCCRGNLLVWIVTNFDSKRCTALDHGILVLIHNQYSHSRSYCDLVGKWHCRRYSQHALLKFVFERRMCSFSLHDRLRMYGCCTFCVIPKIV